MTHRTGGPALALASACLLLAAGCSDDTPVAVPAPDATTTASPTASPTPSPTPSPTASPTAATPCATGTSGSSVTFQGARIVLPGGWTYDGSFAGTEGTACLDPRGADDCTVQLVDLRTSGDRSGTDLDIDAPTGWSMATDLSSCQQYDPSLPAPGEASGYLVSTPGPKQFRPFGAKTAAFRTYALTCDSGEALGDVRMWFLPDSGIAVVDSSDRDDATVQREVERIVETADLSALRS